MVAANQIGVPVGGTRVSAAPSTRMAQGGAGPSEVAGQNRQLAGQSDFLNADDAQSTHSRVRQASAQQAGKNPEIASLRRAAHDRFWPKADERPALSRDAYATAGPAARGRRSSYSFRGATTNTMNCHVLGLLFSVSVAQAATPPLTVEAAYAEITTYRDRHDAVVWNGAPATTQELREVATDLERGLARMDDPTVNDLAEGSLYLRFRRYNLLMDLAKVRARLGDDTAALAALQGMADMQWSSSMWSDVREDAHVRALLERQPPPTFLVPESVMRRFGEDGVLASMTPPSQGERLAGLARLWAVARDGFVWFDHVPDLDWDRKFAEVAPRVASAPDEETYYRELMKFVASLRDGHSNVYVPERLAARFYARPGIRTRRIDGRVIVTDVATNLPERDTLRVGDEVVTIDGQPVDLYAETSVAPYQSSSTPQDLEVRTYRHALLSGADDRPVALGMRDVSGRSYAVTLARAMTGFTWQPAGDAFHLRPDGIAVLNVRQFENDAAVKALEANLDRLKQAKGLVLDLRGNGGGSSHHGLALLSWLQREPIPTPISRYRETISYREAGNRRASTDWRVLDAKPFKQARPYVFEGPVVMLVNAGTFSAAEDTAASFRLSGRGVIIGTPTGGSTGQPYSFPLPGGGSARICVKRDMYPDGSSFVGIGVLPDRTVAPTISDVRAGKDPVLEVALSTIENLGAKP